MEVKVSVLQAIAMQLEVVEVAVVIIAHLLPRIGKLVALMTIVHLLVKVSVLQAIAMQPEVAEVVVVIIGHLFPTLIALMTIFVHLLVFLILALVACMLQHDLLVEVGVETTVMVVEACGKIVVEELNILHRIAIGGP